MRSGSSDPRRWSGNFENSSHVSAARGPEPVWPSWLGTPEVGFAAKERAGRTETPQNPSLERPCATSERHPLQASGRPRTTPWPACRERREQTPQTKTYPSAAPAALGASGASPRAPPLRHRGLSVLFVPPRAETSSIRRGAMGDRQSVVSGCGGGARARGRLPKRDGGGGREAVVQRQPGPSLLEHPILRALGLFPWI